MSGIVCSPPSLGIVMDRMDATGNLVPTVVACKAPPPPGFSSSDELPLTGFGIESAPIALALIVAGFQLVRRNRS